MPNIGKFYLFYKSKKMSKFPGRCDELVILQVIQIFSEFFFSCFDEIVGGHEQIVFRRKHGAVRKFPFRPLI